MYGLDFQLNILKGLKRECYTVSQSYCTRVIPIDLALLWVWGSFLWDI